MFRWTRERCPATAKWEPRKAYLSAMREWLPRFATLGQPVTFEDLVLFGDCYYLPYEQGADAEALCESLRGLLAADPTGWGADAGNLRRQLARLHTFCLRMTELHHRPLFYALSRRIWELREELDLLDRFIEFYSGRNQSGTSFTSDFHRPGTYRGGMVPFLQRLLRQHPDGTFTPARLEESSRTIC